MAESKNVLALDSSVDQQETETGEEAKKKKKLGIDKENLNSKSMRQLVKMVKELSIKSNRTALQILPGNNQTA